jgi:hypothetical protein
MNGILLDLENHPPWFGPRVSVLTADAADDRLPVGRQDRWHWEATMKKRHVVVLSMLAGVAFGALAVQGLHAEDTYIRNLPLDALTVPVPIIPPGSTLDLRPVRSPDAADQMTGYTPVTKDTTIPSIGLSIKAPLDGRK